MQVAQNEDDDTEIGNPADCLIDHAQQHAEEYVGATVVNAASFLATALCRLLMHTGLTKEQAEQAFNLAWEDELNYLAASTEAKGVRRQ